MNYSYVTVITNDKYYPGLCSLCYSLKKVGACYPLAVLIPRTMDTKTKELIYALDVSVIEADDINLNSTLLSDNPIARWSATFFKLNIFSLTQFNKIVFLDSDMIVVKNIDELFEKPHLSSVVAGQCVQKDWKRLNSGLMVIVPDQNEFEKLLSSLPYAFRERKEQELGFGDQDVVNYCYPDWFYQKELILDESYNVLSFYIHEFSALYGYNSMKVLHFAEALKPWQYSRLKKIKHICSGILHGDIQRVKLFTLYLKYLKKGQPHNI